METKFTPGPWEIVSISRKYPDRLDWPHDTFFSGSVQPTDNSADYRGDVCRLQSTEHIDGIEAGETEANAHLIAAAPDLYHALDRIMEYARTGAEVRDVDHTEQPQFVRAYAALAKARGES